MLELKAVADIREQGEQSATPGVIESANFRQK